MTDEGESRRSTVRLLDIEGTTTPFEFVHEVLFPYARANLETHLADRLAKPEMREWLRSLRQELAEEQGETPPLWRDATDADPLASAVRYCLWLMDRDRKSTALKALQGRIWEEGYASGAIVAPVYPDVPIAFERWRREKKTIAIFSSGSVHAQRLLFTHTDHGDLRRYLYAYFDTKTGPKKEAASYRRIAAEIGRSEGDILFVSDVVEELDAALAAGMHTALCVRPGRPRLESAHHPVVETFDPI